MTPLPITYIAAHDAPIACTLSPREHRNRTRDLADLARRSLLRRDPIDGGQRLTFADRPDVERELAAAVAAEATCCSFLTMRFDRRAEGLVLDVTGPAESQPIIAEVFA